MSAMATELKTIDHPTRHELGVYVKHVEDALGRAMVAIKDSKDRDAIAKVHTRLCQVAAGQVEREGAA